MNKVVNVCGKVVGERQEQRSQMYERRVVRKVRVIADDKNIMSFFHLVDDFAYGKFYSAVNSISEQINPFKHQSNVCVCVRACVRACVNYVNSLFIM